MTKKPTPLEYVLLVEQAPIMIWRADLSTGCDYFNDRWLAFTGRSMEQENGNGWAEGVHPDDLARCLDIYLDAFRRHEPFEMEYRLRRHDGAYRWIFDRGVPIHDADGSFQGFTGSCIDVTERIEAQEALRREKEQQIRQLHGLLPICMFCRKIRDDAGYWQSLEQYVSEHSDTNFSHGICEKCCQERYPGMEL